MIDGYRQLNVTGVSRTVGLIQIASRASVTHEREKTILGSCLTYGESPHDPSAGSYRPPGTGLRRLSKVLSFSMRLTEMD